MHLHKLGGYTDLRHQKIPDYSIYKISKEETPVLYAYQEKLAREGMKDPWIRNYAYMYQVRKDKPLVRRYSSLLIGFVIGMAGFATHVYYDKKKFCNWHKHNEPKYRLLYEIEAEKKGIKLPHSHSGHH